MKGGRTSAVSPAAACRMLAGVFSGGTGAGRPVGHLCCGRLCCSSLYKFTELGR
jgi:hypothetical protein